MSMSFRNLLISLLLGLILLSTGAVAWLGITGVAEAIRNLTRGQMAASLDSVGAQIEGLFDPAERMLLLARANILSADLSIEDPEQLARRLAHALTFEKDIAWLSFGYPDGAFAGATARDGRVYLNTSRPDGRPPTMREVLPDGRAGAPFPEKGVATFDARLRPWFQKAVASDGLVWLDPYDFVGGGRGIGVSLAVRSPDGALIGVLGLDFELDDIAARLRKLADQTGGETMVFFPDGTLVASSEGRSDSPVIRAVRKVFDQPGKKLRTNGGGWVSDAIDINGQTFLVGLRLNRISGGLACVSAVVFERATTLGAIERGLRRSFLTAAGALIVSLAAAFLLARRIAHPLRAVTENVRRIGRFELQDAEFPRSHIREVEVLSSSVQRMRDSLQSFAQYVPVDVVRDLIRSGGVAGLGGIRRTVTLMFCDLKGFTTYAEKVDPETAVETLTAYFEVFVRAIHAQGGVIDKFLGDGIMALFNAPSAVPAHAAAACRATLLAHRELGAAGDLGGYHPRVRTGLHTGEALVGNVGTEQRFSFTAIGDSVNLASRLESLNKRYGTSIIASDVVREECGDEEFLWRLLDLVAVEGRREKLEIFELVNFRADASEEQRRIAEVYPKALRLFWRQDPAAARAALEQIAATDPPARALLARISGEGAAAL
ncbi:MAG: adenylate/guanylate cyclase domain-containing protein [Chthoniobacterales bacterium]